MSNEVWIDGFNLFHQWPRTRHLFRPDADFVAGQDEALRILSNVMGKKRARITIYMDGGLRRESMSVYGLRVVWSGPGKKADDTMVEGLYGKAGKTRGIAVISNDRSLCASLRSLGAKILPVDEFLMIVENQTAGRYRSRRIEEEDKYRELSEAEVDAWMEVFEEEEEHD